jgi:hypothetical protein
MQKLDAQSRSRPRTRGWATARAAAGNGQAFVSGTWDPATPSAKIVRVYPADPGNLVDPPDAQSPLVVRSLDASGKVLGEVGAPITLLFGPAAAGTFAAPVSAGARVVELVIGGTVVDRTAASQPPKVRVTAPKAGAHVRKGALVVRWTATDADSGDRQATVEYAADGRNYRIVWQGPDRGSTKVPASFLEGSTHARVRVTVNDGFNDAAATSGVIRADGSAPVVKILTPTRATKLQADNPVVLSGSAGDDAERALSGKRLTWFAGTRRLGTGSPLRVKLAAGRTVLRLVARDAHGRTASATRTVTVGAPTLLLKSLDVQDKVAHGAKTVKVRLATSTPATVTANGRRYTLGTRATTLVVALAKKPASGVISPRLTVRGRAKGQKPLRVDLVVYRK